MVMGSVEVKLIMAKYIDNLSLARLPFYPIFGKAFRLLLTRFK